MSNTMVLNRPKFHDYKPGEFPKDCGVFDTVELKYDGWWGQLLLSGMEWELYSRTGQRKAHGPLKTRWERTLIHGEYVFGTEWAGENPEYHGKVMAHTLVELNGRTMDIAQRDARQRLENTVALLAKEEIVSGVLLAPQWPINFAKKLWENYPNFEGLVFKNSRAPWGASYGRMKREASMDYICLGFERSESDSYAGWGVASVLGGLLWPGKTEPTLVCKVSGISDEQRKEFYEHPERYKGRVFEANGKRITRRGALRHPNFLRWRDDKPATNCVWK